MNRRQLMQEMQNAYAFLNRKKILLSSNIKDLDDKKATFLALALKGTNLLNQFYKENPDHKIVHVLKKVVSNAQMEKIYLGAKEILLSEDRRRGYPSLADWFFNRKFLEDKEHKPKNYYYSIIE